MASLDDLKIISLSNLPPEEGMKLVLEMRLRRRLVEPKPTREKRKEITAESAIANLSEKQLADLYYTLMAKRQENLL